jgi:H+-translocating NAD(P) transhydrogenase subunit alpha
VIIGVPKEIFPGERRVALVPLVIPNLKKLGLDVIIQAGAGDASGYRDSDFTEKGAQIVADRDSVFRSADIVVQFLAYGANDKNGQEIFLSFGRDSS